MKILRYIILPICITFIVSNFFIDTITTNVGLQLSVHLLSTICFFYLTWTCFFPYLIYQKSLEEFKPRWDKLDNYRCGGRIGLISMTSPLIRIGIDTTGLLIRPFLLKGLFIPSDKIHRVEKGKNGNAIKIYHLSSFVSSPIILFPYDKHLFDKISKLIK